MLRIMVDTPFNYLSLVILAFQQRNIMIMTIVVLIASNVPAFSEIMYSTVKAEVTTRTTKDLKRV
jgi:hypothetical protein